MCGIVGYVGKMSAAPILLEALSKLEYRGYDSSGLAVAENGCIRIEKSQGRLKILRDKTDDGATFTGTCGLGHTRWATHGAPSDQNAHPQASQSGRVAIVHNGIVENYGKLKEFLTAHGYTFVSQTDTEVVAQLIDYCYKGDPLAAVKEAVAMLEGSYALGIMFADYPWQLIAVRKDSPLIIGLGEGCNIIASDIPALIKHTRDIIRLGERELAVVTAEGVTVFDTLGQRVVPTVQHVTWDIEAAERGGYAHFMLKEIMEQGTALKNTINPRIDDDKLVLELKHITDEDLKGINQIYIIACGSAYHVGCVARLMLQKLINVPVSVELASEFRYNRSSVDDKTLCVIISQSGETIDTLFALREAKRLGGRTISIVNVIGSTIATESEDVLYTHAGPEIAVATTKAYSTQLSVVYILSLYIARVKNIIGDDEIKAGIKALRSLPALVEGVANDSDKVSMLAAKFFNHHDVFFIGRGIDYALALEGSLKLKEISYIHSEAYPAGELKHGTISLVEEGTLVVALMTHEALIDKMISNSLEVRARGAKVIAIAVEGNDRVLSACDHVIWLPKADELVMPSLLVVPLQLFAYYIALNRGCDIDKPRNLAKSVTVE